MRLNVHRLRLKFLSAVVLSAATAFAVSCAAPDANLKKEAPIVKKEASNDNAIENKGEDEEPPFEFPKETGKLTEPAYFAQTPVSFYLIAENFPIIMDVLRIPALYLEQLNRLNDDSLSKQIAFFDSEIPKKIKMRMYEDADHINSWMPRLLALEILAGRGTDAGRSAREKLSSFYFDNAGEPTHGIDFEPRKSVVSAMLFKQGKKNPIEGFYAEVANLPYAFALAYERLAVARFKTEMKAEGKASALKNLAAVLLKARLNDKLYDVAKSLAAYKSDAESRELYAFALCLNGEKSCAKAVSALGKSGVPVASELKTLAAAANALQSAKTLAKDESKYCQAIAEAGFLLFDAGMSGDAKPVVEANEQKCLNNPAFVALAAQTSLYLGGSNPKLNEYLEAGAKIKNYDVRFLTAALNAHYLGSLPVIFTPSASNVVMGAQWYFKTGPGKEMDEQLTAYGKLFPAEAEFLRLMMTVLSMRTNQNQPDFVAEANSLAQKASELQKKYPKFGAFGTLAVILYAQRATADLSHMLQTGEGVDNTDSASLLALASHMIKLGFSGSIPSWYENAVASLPADDRLKKPLASALALASAVRDPKTAKTYYDFYLKSAASQKIDEEELPMVSALLFNCRALAFLDGKKESSALKELGLKNWPLFEYFGSGQYFKEMNLFFSIELSQKGKLSEAADAAMAAYVRASTKSDALGASWHLAHLYYQMKNADKAQAFATGTYNIYETFKDQIILDEKRRFALTLFDNSFDFTMKTGPKKTSELSLGLSFKFSPKLFVLPPLPFAKMEKAAKKMMKKGVVVPEFKEKDAQENEDESKDDKKNKENAAEKEKAKKNTSEKKKENK